MNIVLLGAPGAGKGTQAQFLTDHYHLKLVGTGDMFRKAVTDKTELGAKAHVYMQAGKLVPDELVFGIIQDNLTHGDWEKGLLFDGFPRTVLQAQELDRIVGTKGAKIDKVIFMSVPREMLIQRLTNRRTCHSCRRIFGSDAREIKDCPVCGGSLFQRGDDTAVTVSKRLKEYECKTQPVLDHYGSKVVHIDGSLTIDEVTKKLISSIE